MLRISHLLFCLLLTGSLKSIHTHHDDGKSDYKQVNAELTVKLLRTLTEDDNALFSPILLTNSLLILANSACDDGRNEILKVLNIKSEEDLEHVNMDAKHIFEIRQHLLELKSKSNKIIVDKTQIDLLPKLMMKTDKNLKEKFSNLIKDNYPTDVYKMAEWSEETQKTETKMMNEWFSSKSKTGLLNRVLDDNDLTSDVKMLMVNGASFKGAWKGKLFDVASTKEGEFKNAEPRTTMADFMNKENALLKINEYSDDKMMFIEVPFTEHDDGHNHKHGTKLVLLVGTASEPTLDTILDQFTQEKLNERLIKTLSSPVKKIGKFSLPKMNFEKEYELKDTLKELGVKEVFEEKANFSRMIDGADLSKSELFLNQIEHKAIVRWTEESDDSTTDMPESTGDIPEILINKPFAFFILDDPQGDKKMKKRDADHSHDGHDHDESKHNEAIILFAGRVKAFTKDLTFGKKDD